MMTSKYRTLKKKVVSPRDVLSLINYHIFSLFLQVKARDARLHQHYRGEVNALRESFQKILLQYKLKMEMAYDIREKGVKKRR